MFKLKKKSRKALLYGIFIFNLIILLSFIFDLLIRFSILSSSMTIFSLPIEILSSNFIVVILILAIEILIVSYSWYCSRSSKIKKDLKKPDIKFDLLIDDSEENIINTHENKKITFEERLNLNYSDLLGGDSLNFELDSSNVDHSYESVQSENTVLLDEEDFDISPGFLAKDDELLAITTNKENLQCNIKDSINDHQFALYQNIVNSEWLYENANDRERIGFDNNAINESNISLSDLNFLIKSKLIIRKEISHPTGSFFVFTSNPNIEREIICLIVRRIFRRNKIKTIKRKIDFPNWEEFGLMKKNWQFDIVLPQQAILVAIWTENAFLSNNSKISIKQEYKDELKAIIAASTLKFNTEGKVLIITNSKERMGVISKYIKITGWGKASILNFNSNSIESNLINFIN